MLKQTSRGFLEAWNRRLLQLTPERTLAKLGRGEYLDNLHRDEHRPGFIPFRRVKRLVNRCLACGNGYVSHEELNTTPLGLFIIRTYIGVGGDVRKAGWHFILTDDIPDSWGPNTGGVITDGRRVLFWHSLSMTCGGPSFCHVTSGIPAYGNGDEDMGHRVCSYPDTAENEAVLLSALNRMDEGCDLDGAESPLRMLPFDFGDNVTDRMPEFTENGFVGVRLLFLGREVGKLQPEDCVSLSGGVRAEIAERILAVLGYDYVKVCVSQDGSVELTEYEYLPQEELDAMENLSALKSAEEADGCRVEVTTSTVHGVSCSDMLEGSLSDIFHIDMPGHRENHDGMPLETAYSVLSMAGFRDIGKLTVRTEYDLELPF